MSQQTPFLIELQPFPGINPQGCAICGEIKWISNDDAIREGWKILQTCSRKYEMCPQCIAKSTINNPC